MNINDLFKLNPSRFENIDGIWYAKSMGNISYPDEGNENCSEIEENSFWFAHRNNFIINTINSFPSETIFDIGGGNGFVTKTLLDANFDTVLLEPGKFGIKTGKNRGIKKLICSDIEGIKFLNGTIPSVGIFDVLEHIKDDEDFLSSLRNLLCTNGRLYITVPAYKFLWTSIDEYSGHFTRYTLRALKKKLRNSGFSIEYSTYFFMYLPLPILIFRKIPELFRPRNHDSVQASSEHHNAPTGISKGFIDFFNKFENRLARKKRKILFGGSCFIVAKKIDNENSV